MNASAERHFTKEELCNYLEVQNAKIQPRSRSWNNISAKVIWSQTQGELSEPSVNRLNHYALTQYKNNDRRRPLLFFKKFLLRKPEYERFARLLAIPKVVRYRGADPVRIEDVKAVLNDISHHDFRIEAQRERNRFYCLFYAYTGIRPETATHLSVDDFREALARDKPYLYITSKHEPKVKSEYYIPLHPALIPLVRREIDRYEANPPKKRNGSPLPFINQSIIQEYLQKNRIGLSKRPSDRFQQNHFRKFFQQQSRRNNLDKDYTNFIMNHEQYGLSKESYDTFIEEHEEVYYKYVAAWGSINLLDNDKDSTIEEKPLTKAEILENEIAEKRKMLEAIQAVSEENIQAHQDRYEQFLEEERIKDDEISSLILESIQLDQEIENAKSEKGIRV